MASRTPGGHRLIRTAWSSAMFLLVAALGVAVFAHAVRAAAIVAGAALVLFAAGYVGYLARHLLFERDVARAERALAAADLETARRILAPLLDHHSDMPAVQRAAGRTLYALGDPLSAASLLERAARSFRDDAAVATTLVASYAALNRGGDARRAAAVAPRAVDVRLALGWSELVALGGDRPAGAAIVHELRERADVRDDLARAAMCAALGAIAAAGSGDAAAAAASLSELAGLRDRLPAYERAFVGYLEGVALRELARPPGAIDAFAAAMDAAPGTIGEALARRETANLRARLSQGPPAPAAPQRPYSSSPSSQPSAEDRSASNS